MKLLSGICSLNGLEMKSYNFSLSQSILYVLALLLAGSLTPAIAQKAVIKVVTYNIRLLTPDDAPNIWSNRKEKVFTTIREAEPDVFGLQEAVKEQVADLEATFSGYTRIGVGRDDGKEAGEFSPLFYNSKKYSLISSGTFWLSQTPAVAGSRGWDAACNRVVSWVQLKDKKSTALLFVFCTHFDHVGEIARRNSAKLLLHAVDSLAGYRPAIVLGDFNSLPDSEPYSILTDYSNHIHLTDARLICQDIKGPEYTFTGFKVGGMQGIRIDYIFIRNSVQVISYKVNETNNGEYYPSDHLPVSATLKVY
jgi:endonuclease/exonuclease/phosphatase family metal-dependent hydrolase